MGRKVNKHIRVQASLIGLKPDAFWVFAIIGLLILLIAVNLGIKGFIIGLFLIVVTYFLSLVYCKFGDTITTKDLPRKLHN